MAKRTDSAADTTAVDSQPQRRPGLQIMRQDRSSDRMLKMTDGTRLRLGCVAYYKPVGDELIHFFGPSGDLLAELHPPADITDPKKRNRFREEALKTLDQLMDVD